LNGKNGIYRVVHFCTHMYTSARHLYILFFVHEKEMPI